MLVVLLGENEAVIDKIQKILEVTDGFEKVSLDHADFEDATRKQTLKVSWEELVGSYKLEKAKHSGVTTAIACYLRTGQRDWESFKRSSQEFDFYLDGSNIVEAVRQIAKIHDECENAYTYYKLEIENYKKDE